MKLYRNKKSGVECYMTDEEVQMMKDKKLFSNYTLVPNAKELNPTQPPDEIVEFTKRATAKKEATVGKSLKVEHKTGEQVVDVEIKDGTPPADRPLVIGPFDADTKLKVEVSGPQETKPKPKRKRTKKENKDGNK